MIIQGGLGNQLFQAAFATFAKESSSERIYVSTNGYHHDRLRKLEIDFEALNLRTIRVPRTLRRATARLLPSMHSSFQPNFVPHLGETRPLISGYFQDLNLALATPDYFKSYLAQQLMVENSQEPYVAVHLRLGDYLSSGVANYFGITSPRWALRQALQLAESQKIERILVFTDSDELVAKLPEINSGPFELKSAKSPWTALAMMSNASALIMSNSSLSWWAAFSNHEILGIKGPVIMPFPWQAVPSQMDISLRHPGWSVVTRELFRSYETLLR